MRKGFEGLEGIWYRAGMEVRSLQTPVAMAGDEAARLSAGEQAELIASLEAGRADIAAGDFDVITPERLRMEFEAIVRDDATDDTLDALLGSAAAK